MAVLGILELLLLSVCITGASALPQVINTPSDGCKVESKCRAVCGDVVLDITDVFTYPVKDTDDSDGYVLFFSPCSGLSCKTDPEYSDAGNAAICQSQPDKFLNFTCGLTNDTVWTLEKTDPYKFSVLYDGGTESRASIVTFYEDPTMTDTRFIYTGEGPTMIYNFAVRGKFVGQPTSRKCMVDDSDPCVATCSGEKIDISKAFKYPTRTLAGNFTYSYSPCDGGFKCGATESSALCQSSPGFNYSLGSVSNIEWSLNQSTPNYVFTVEYKNGDSDRIARVKFIEDSKMLSSTFVFKAESKPLEYEFEVRGSNIGQPTDIGCSVEPSNPCQLRCNGSLAVDIADVFNYPVSLQNQYYRFRYDPCKGTTCGCPSKHSNNAVCQFDDTLQFDYGCGNVSAVQWTVMRTNPYVFSISYTGGDTKDCDGNEGVGSRSSVVVFYEDSSAGTPTFKYMEEDPKLTYKFEVRGSNVGQKVNRSDCVVDPRTPCVAICNKTIKIDLSKIFSNPITILGPEGESFIFSPCVGYSCGSPVKNSSVCLGSQSCGQLNTVRWTLTQIQPFYIFTITYTGGDAGDISNESRSSIVTFVENSEVNRITAVYAGPLNRNSYVFDVVGSCVGQPACTGKGTETRLFHHLLVTHAVLLVVACVIVLLLGVAIAVGIGLRDRCSAKRKLKKLPLLK